MDITLEDVLFCTVSLILSYMWVRWRIKRLNTFKELGIPGPKPNFLFGNILELNAKGPLRCQKEWIQKHGKILGFFHGMKPVLLVADPDLLKKIFIKDFNLFSDRPENVPLRVHSFLDHIIPASDIMDNILPNLKGRKWKEIRSILSPTFSANKLKMMIPAVNEVTDVTISILEEKANGEDIVNIYEILQRLTLDLICAQAFAMNINSQRNPNDPLLRSARIIFDLPYTSKIILLGRLEILAMALNFLQMFIRNKGYIPPLKITKVVDGIIKQRRKDANSRRPDLLQLLIDASSSPTEEMSTLEELSTKIPDNLKTKRQIKLTDLEIKSNALVVFLAGYETTSSALAYAFHFLAKYPEMQKKLQDEIDGQLQKKGLLDYYNVNNFQCVERFLLETMRFYSPGTNFISRLSAADIDYGYVRIPKGMQIDVPVDYIHHSDEYFLNPEEFNPERFLSDHNIQHKTVNYWAFGVGPRGCVGTRLVHLTSKIVIVKILRHFTIYPVESAAVVTSKLRISTMVPTKILIKLKKRTTSNTASYNNNG